MRGMLNSKSTLALCNDLVPLPVQLLALLAAVAGSTDPHVSMGRWRNRATALRGRVFVSFSRHSCEIGDVVAARSQYNKMRTCEDQL
jgi:hypothetical protein